MAMVVLIFNDCIKTKEAQGMLNENIRNLRKSKGLSQEELAIRLNVVRQTISKWEKGLSVPDSSMIISLAEELDTSVSTLLGETVQEECLDKENMKSISEKLEVINLQLAKRSSMRIHTCLLYTSQTGSTFPLPMKRIPPFRLVGKRFYDPNAPPYKAVFRTVSYTHLDVYKRQL